MGTEGEFQEDRREWIGREGKWEGDSVGRLTEKKEKCLRRENGWTEEEEKRRGKALEGT